MNATDKVFSGIEQEDLRIFELLFELHYSRLYSIAEGIVKNTEEAESVVMDVFEILWNTRNLYDDMLSVKIYLFRTVFDHSLKVIENKPLEQIIINDSTKVKKRTVVAALNNFLTICISNI
jgi:hypothetical protein